MATTVRCPHCGRDVPRPSTPDARCPACQKPLRGSPAGAASSGVFEDMALGPEAEVSQPNRPITRPAAASQSSVLAPPAAPRRPQTESSLAAARMAAAPTFKSAKPKRGAPVLPIAAGVVLIVAITAFALLRGGPAGADTATRPASDLVVPTVGRPPEPTAPPVPDPEPETVVVTRDLPDSPPPARERRKAAERETPRAARPAAAPAREVARNEKPATPARPAAAPKVEPKVEAKAEPEPAPAPTPPPVPPPQFAAAPSAPPPAASAPMAIGPSYAREGYQKAKQKTPNCVASSLRLPTNMVELEGETATVKFAVDETGAVSQFSYLSGPSDPRVANAIWGAIQRCEWVPGATAQGRPITLWVTMPFKFK